jgi:hypothetical protein
MTVLIASSDVSASIFRAISLNRCSFFASRPMGGLDDEKDNPKALPRTSSTISNGKTFSDLPEGFDIHQATDITVPDAESGQATAVETAGNSDDVPQAARASPYRVSTRKRLIKVK